jgi:Domain of unknown function DUF11
MARHDLAVLAGVLAAFGAWAGLSLPSAATADGENADLVVQPPTQSGPSTFSVDAYNNGPQAATSVELRISGLGNYQVSSQASNCQQTGSELVCDSPSWEDTHVNGRIEHFAFTFTTGSGPVTLTASVSSATLDPDPSNNSATSVTWTPASGSGTPPPPTATPLPTGNRPPTNPQPPTRRPPGTNPTAGHGGGPGTAHSSGAPASPSAGTAGAAAVPQLSGDGTQGAAAANPPLVLANGDNVANEGTMPPDGLSGGRFAGTVAAPILGGVIAGLLVERRRRRAEAADPEAANVEDVWLVAPTEAKGQAA